jgi:hypothetical protein
MDIEESKPSRQEIGEFLTSFKLSIDYGRCTFIGRQRTDQDLIDLNLTRRQALEAVCALQPDDYVDGPRRDDSDESKEVWIFGYNHEGTEVYVKLRLNPTRRNEIPRGTVWSLHKAEYRLRYPFRGGAR